MKLGNSVKIIVREEIGESLYYLVYDSVTNSVDGSVYWSVWDLVYDSVRNRL
jgi:hypothetical protein